jgi:hypothetical protein
MVRHRGHNKKGGFEPPFLSSQMRSTQLLEQDFCAADFELARRFDV